MQGPGGGEHLGFPLSGLCDRACIEICNVLVINIYAVNLNVFSFLF